MRGALGDMKVNLKNNVLVNRVLSQLAAERKKTVIAVLLITVMVFMWSRVIGKKSPASAKAATAAEMKADMSGSNSGIIISFVELPKVKGRNDVLSRDFFAMDQRSFGSDTEASFVSSRGRGYANGAAEKLRLEVIGLGANPQAFINDKLLGVGDKLVVRDGVSTYEYELIVIEKNRVLMRCGEEEIELKLAQMLEASD